MLGKIVLILGAVACVNSQVISLANPGGACACGGQLLAPPPLDLLTTLASLSPPCTLNAPIIAPPCSCNKLAPFLVSNGLPAGLLLPNSCGAPQVLDARGLVPELLLSPSCGCGGPLALPTASPCGCGNPLVLPGPLALPLPSCGCGSCGCGCAALPTGCPNPFLPAASPVSAMAPQTVSSLLPPVCPYENRALYLRKIPIPPPQI